MMKVPCVLGVFLRVRRWKPLKRVRHPYYSVFNVVRSQNSPHQNRSAAAPHAGLNEVTLNTAFDYVFNTSLKIIEALYPLQLEMSRVLEAFPVDAADYLRGEYAWYRNAQKDGIWV